MTVLRKSALLDSYRVTIYVVQAVIFDVADGELSSIVCWRPTWEDAQVAVGLAGFTIDIVRCNPFAPLPKWWPDQCMTHWDERRVPRLYILPVGDRP